MADTKRRLPMVKTAEANDDDNRPPWHWVGFGTLLIFAAWLPLAWVASLLEARLLSRFAQASSLDAIAESIHDAAPQDVARLRFGLLVLLGLPLMLGAFAGGYIVGRWSRDAGPRQAALAGLSAALVTCVLSWVDEQAVSAAPLVGILLAVPLAALGGWLGTRKRTAMGVAA